MLPGIAGVCMFMIFMTMVNVYACLRGAYGVGRAKSTILILCTLLAAGIFGLLRLQKWGCSFSTWYARRRGNACSSARLQGRDIAGDTIYMDDAAHR
jgi:hypothetical protein